MDAYMDTNVAVRLALGDIRKITKPAQQAMERYDLLISPMALLELQYLFEIGLLAAPASQALAHLQEAVGLAVCRLPFADIAHAACNEAWTRDVFDRVIVAHARYAPNAPLITADTNIQNHYEHAIW